jgi:DNA-binding FadR family transcriptional regulator
MVRPTDRLSQNKNYSEECAQEKGLPLEAIEPRRLYRQIADQLRQLIDQGEYPVGSRLPTERSLADKLGVSRPTALEVEGRLRIRVGSGIYVIEHRPTALPAEPRPIEGPFEILRARAFIESAVAEEAARKATQADVARLDAVLAEAAEIAPAQRDGDRFLILDRCFHTAIAATLENAVLVRCVGELFDLRINPYFERLARHTLDGLAHTAAVEEHRAIRDAIAARDPAAARVAMHEHLERSHQRFARDLGEGEGIEAEGEVKRSRAVA